MDSSSPPVSNSHENDQWLLGFSLSNTTHHMSTISMPPSSSSNNNNNNNNSHLSLFHAFNSSSAIIDRQDNDSSDPKLEDFFSLGGNTSSNGMCPYTSEAPATNGTEMYDSELKSIAASFLCGFSNDDSHKQIVPVVPEPAAKKALDNFGQRTSIYRGVTRHRWTGRYEAHLWDNSCRREGQSRKGRQVYLGGYDKEDKAARAYDLAALKYWGPTTTTNFPISNYEAELGDMKNMTRQEFVASLRRKSSGFSRGASIYRGVTRHHQHGRWQARIGRVAGNKDLYLGTFSTQEEAAEAYDIAAIKFRGLNAVTNFDMSRYDVKSIVSSNLPIGGANKSKTSSDTTASDNNKSLEGGTRSDDRDLSSASSMPFPSNNTLSFALPLKQDVTDYWSLLGYNNNNSQMYNVAKIGNSSLEYANATPICDNSGNSNFNGGNYYQQQIMGSGISSRIPYATPVAALNGNNNNNYEDSSFGNSLVTPSLYSFQPAKPNISYFQTPIFGIE